MDLKQWQKFEYRPGNAAVAYRADGACVVTVASGELTLAASPEAAAVQAAELNRKNPAKDDRPVISMELRRPKRAEARAFTAKFANMRKALVESTGAFKTATPAERLANQLAIYDAMAEDDVAEIFAKSVRNVGGLASDGVPITTGPELLEVADNDLTFFVISSLYGLMSLKEEEAKASASPSTSSVGAGLSNVSDSGVTPIASGSGTGPSTATETQPESAPSGAPAQ